MLWTRRLSRHTGNGWVTVSVLDTCHTGATLHRLSRASETIPVILGITGSREGEESPEEEIGWDRREERRKRLGDARNRAIGAVMRMLWAGR